jgi:phosphate transport system substrate-binding protein
MPPAEVSPTQFIQFRGSDSVYEIVSKIGYQYMTDFPSVALPMSIGRSAEGYKAVINGTTDIGMASSDIPSALGKWASKQSVQYSQTIIAYDALAVVVHPSNPISNLSLHDLREIFAGRITSWKDLGWNFGGEIQACSQDASRGGFGTWRKFVMGTKDHITFDAKVFESNVAIVEAVLANPHAIGYIVSTVASKSKLKALSVGNIFPTQETISKCQYPICQELRLLTRKSPNEQIQKFIDYCLSSDKGMAILKKHGIATPE